MQNTKNNNNRNCILILGMHRSGTSATAGCLHVIDLNLGNRLYPPDEPNAKGYFENVHINQFNESLLESLYARWYDTLYLPDNWWLNSEIQKRKPELISILEKEFGHKGDFVIKDPRISVLLPFYNEVFNSLKIVPKVIINFRNPFEVAKSLKKRDNLSRSKSLLLWMDSTLKAEAYSRSFSRMFLNYDSLLNNPFETLKRINTLLKLNIKFDIHMESDLNKFVEKKLKHHSTNEAKTDSGELYPVNLLFNKLQEINLRKLSKTTQEEIDNIGKLFYSSFHFYNGIDEEMNVVLKIVTGSKKTTFSESSNTGENNIIFKVNNPNSVSEFILFPASRKVVLQLQETIIKTRTGKSITIHPTENNAEKVLKNGIMIFESDFPWVKFRLTEEVAISQIAFSFQYLAMDNYTYRVSIQERDRLEADYLARIIALEEEKNNLIHIHEDSVNKLREEQDAERQKQELLLNKLTSTINELKSDNDNLKRSIDAFNREHATLQEKINHLHDTNSNLNKEKSDLLKDNRKLILNNEKLLANHKKSIFVFETILGELKAKQLELIKEKDTLLSKYKDDLAGLKQSIGNMAKDLETKTLELGRKTEELIIAKVELTELRTRFNTVDKELNNKKNRIDDLKFVYSKASQELEASNKEMARLKQTYETSINLIEEKNTELTTELVQLKSLLEEITQSNSWKLGRAITWPVRKPKEKIRKGE